MGRNSIHRYDYLTYDIIVDMGPWDTTIRI